LKTVKGRWLTSSATSAARNFLVDHLVERNRAADVALDVSHRPFTVFKALVEFFLGEGGFEFVILAVHFFIGRQQAKLFGAPHGDFVLNHLVQNVQTQGGGLLAGGRLLGGGDLVVVILVNVGAENLPAIHGSHHVATGLRITAREGGQQGGGRERRGEPGK